MLVIFNIGTKSRTLRLY